MESPKEVSRVTYCALIGTLRKMNFTKEQVEKHIAGVEKRLKSQEEV